MKKIVVFSIKPKYANEILAGRKTVELRRRFSISKGMGAIALIYSTSPVKMIVASAIIANVQKLPIEILWKECGYKSAVLRSEFDEYFYGIVDGYGITLTDIHTFDQPLSLAELNDHYGFTAPQSYRYVSGVYRDLLSRN